MDAAASPTESTSPEPPDLPEAVWEQVVALTAAVLPALDPLPAPLRRVASFAPQRRARLGATPISLALTRDDEVRAGIAELVAEGGDELVAAVTEDAVPAGADAVEVAALTWLLRPEGWAGRLPALLARVAGRAEERRQSEGAAEVTRLRTALTSAEGAQRDERLRAREQLEALRAEHAALRRRLGEARAEARHERAAAERAAAEATSVAAAAEVRVTAAEAEARRLRARVAELEETAGAARREERVRRDDTSLRARVLLDALVEAGQGLRRELGLPAADGTPGARLEEELAAAVAPDGPVTGAPVSALQLESWLQVPRSRLLVDGYNVSKAAWPDSSLDVQRSRLLADLAALVSRTGAETTVVFDAAATTTRAPVNPPRGVKVVFSPVGVIADDVLRDLVAAEPAGRMVVVVTSDQAVVRDVRRDGARAVPSPVLLGLLGH